ncbi:hypothetical protein [Actinoplanes sp. CA-252034]|uniref:hypothetical protein n=1 Tax=Actinoplanes sp. CA-252034 TaxID=3239906 RepID=UPI003D99032C
MPIKPVTGEPPIPVDSADDVAVIVEHLARGDRDPRWLGDHFAFLAGTRPEWFRPYQERVVAELLDRFEAAFDDQLLLFAGAPDDSVEVLARRLRDGEELHDVLALAAIGTEAARTAIAEAVRGGADRAVYEDTGIWIPTTGPAEYRFSTERRAVFLELGDFPDADHPVGLPIDRVVTGASSPVVWHYLSLGLAEVPGLPAWPTGHAHLVAPASIGHWTLFAEPAPDGRYHGEQVVDDDPDDFVDAPEFGRGRVVLRPYGADLVYCNGHVHLTPGLVGTAGGPPIGLYPNPSCPSCKRLMFHTITVSSTVREYGDGPRSLYLCEECRTVAVTATGWN